jgi:predicted DNA binding CopG/RHH family protein
MVIELPALITAAGAVGSLAKQAVSIVEGIRAKDKDAKNELLQKLKELKKNLRLTGELAKLAKSYLQAYENVFKLRLLCSRAEIVLRENLDDCRNRTSATYTGNWKILNILLQTINNDREMTRNVVMDVAEWYSEADRRVINSHIAQFTTAYDHADSHVNLQVADELLHDLQEMTARLLDVEALLKVTNEKILTKLQNLNQIEDTE